MVMSNVQQLHLLITMNQQKQKITLELILTFSKLILVLPFKSAIINLKSVKIISHYFTCFSLRYVHTKRQYMSTFREGMSWCMHVQAFLILQLVYRGTCTEKLTWTYKYLFILKNEGSSDLKSCLIFFLTCTYLTQICQN